MTFALVEVNTTDGAQPELKASNQRFAQTHHWFPDFRPAKPNSGRAVMRSLPLVEQLVKVAGALQNRCLQVSRSLSEKLSSAAASDPKRE